MQESQAGRVVADEQRGIAYERFGFDVARGPDGTSYGQSVRAGHVVVCVTHDASRALAHCKTRITNDVVSKISVEWKFRTQRKSAFVRSGLARYWTVHTHFSGGEKVIATNVVGGLDVSSNNDISGDVSACLWEKCVTRPDGCV